MTDYSVVVPALGLAAPTGQTGTATFDFRPDGVDLKGGFSLEVWFRPDQYPARAGISSTVLKAVLESPDKQGELRINLSDKTIDVNFLGLSCFGKSPGPALGKWVHLSLRYQPGQVAATFWQDGNILLQDVKEEDQRRYRMTTLELCVDFGAQNSFSELRLWSRVLPNAEISESRQKRLIGSEPGLVGYWRLDEESGNHLIDSGSGRFHGFADDVISFRRLDSGLALRLGSMQLSNGGRSDTGDGRRQYWDPYRRPKWASAPETDKHMTHVGPLLAECGKRISQVKDDLVQLDADLKLGEKSAQQLRQVVEAKNLTLVSDRTNKEEAFQRAWEYYQEEEAKVRKSSLPNSSTVDAKDLISRLQEDLSRSRKKIREWQQNVYGLDNFSIEIRMVPGVGGAGVHLPEPNVRIDPDRLSTLKLRFRSVPEEAKPEIATVPQLINCTEVFARRSLAKVGFRVSVVYEATLDPAQDGRVLTQWHQAIPDDPAKAELNTAVILVVARRI